MSYFVRGTYFQEIELPKGESGQYFHLSFPCHKMKAPHQHAQLEANLIRSGKGRYLVGESRIDLVPGTLLWLRPDQPHLLIQFDRRFSMDIWLFDMNQVMDTLGGAHPFLNSQGSELHFTQVPPTQLRVLENLSESYGDCEDSASRNAVTSFALWELQRAGFKGEAQGQHIHPRLKRALALLHQGDRDLQTLSEELECPSSWLSRNFKSQLGISLTEYRQDLKIQAFLELRRLEPARTLLSAALEAGFGSYAQFHRICRQRLGKEPKALG